MSRQKWSLCGSYLEFDIDSWSSSVQCCGQCLCVRPHNEEFSTSPPQCNHLKRPAWGHSRAKLSWAEYKIPQSFRQLQWIDPTLSFLKRDMKQQSNAKRLILQLHTWWCTCQDALTQVYMWRLLCLPSVNINARINVFLLQVLYEKLCHISLEK